MIAKDPNLQITCAPWWSNLWREPVVCPWLPDRSWEWVQDGNDEIIIVVLQAPCQSASLSIRAFSFTYRGSSSSLSNQELNIKRYMMLYIMSCNLSQIVTPKVDASGIAFKSLITWSASFSQAKLCTSDHLVGEGTVMILLLLLQCSP